MEATGIAPVSPLTFSRHKSIDLVLDSRVNLLDTLIAVYFNGFLLRTIIVEQVNGLIEKDVETFLYRFSPVIGALIQRTSIQITHTCYLRWVSVHMVNVLIGLANIAP